MDKDVMLNRMMVLCARSEHCVADIRRKLAALEPADCEEVIGTLCREGYLDDARYARAFARDKSSLQGWGNLKISLSLRKKGIAPEVIAAALAEIDTDAAARKLEQLLRSKLKSLESESDPRKKEARLLRYALSRGYDHEQIKRIYDNIRRD
ncbi:MAG: RecX family transcriptional regulator [Bacteroidales bacterium]|nr:RecX family transcriptional regulator [Bacteroidales bacterium]